MSTPDATPTTTPPPAPLPAAVRHTIHFGLPTALTAAAALSFQGLYTLARAVGWSPKVAWLLPVSVDLAAAIGTVVWLGLPAGHSAARSHAAKTALIAISLSVLGNAAAHLIEAHVLPVTPYVIVAGTSIPPVVVALLVHLGMSLPQHAPTPEAETAEPEPEPKAAPRRTKAEAVAITNRMLEDERHAGRDPDKLTGAVVAAQLQCTPSYARRILRIARGL